MTEVIERGRVSDETHDAAPVTFEAFVAATGARLLRSAVLLTTDRHDAEDLVQTTYGLVFARWRLVRQANDPVAYVRTMQLRAFLNDKRRKRVSTVPLLPDVDTDVVHDESGGNELRLSLLDALRSLPPQDRALLVLRYFEDLPVGVVADRLGMSEGACRTRASRALARLRTQFPDLDDED